MYHWHLDYSSRGLLEKTSKKWVAEQKRLRSPDVVDTVIAETITETWWFKRQERNLVIKAETRDLEISLLPFSVARVRISFTQIRTQHHVKTKLQNKQILRQ